MAGSLPQAALPLRQQTGTLQWHLRLAQPAAAGAARGRGRAWCTGAAASRPSCWLRQSRQAAALPGLPSSWPRALAALLVCMALNSRRPAAALRRECRPPCTAASLSGAPVAAQAGSAQLVGCC